MKYNRSEIMKRAHALRRKYGMSMSDALKYTWTRTKLSDALKNVGYEIIRVRYSVYKKSFLDSVRGSYDSQTKTIEVKAKKHYLLDAKLYMITESIPQVADKINKKVEAHLCARIGTNWREICA